MKSCNNSQDKCIKLLMNLLEHKINYNLKKQSKIDHIFI